MSAKSITCLTDLLSVMHLTKNYNSLFLIFITYEVFQKNLLYVPKKSWWRICIRAEWCLLSSPCPLCSLPSPWSLPGLTGWAGGLSFTRCHGLIHLWAFLPWRTESHQRTGWGRWQPSSGPSAVCSGFLGFPLLASARRCSPWSPCRLVGAFPNLYPGFVSCLPPSVTLGWLVLRWGDVVERTQTNLRWNPSMVTSWRLTWAVGLSFVILNIPAWKQRGQHLPRGLLKAGCNVWK